MLESRAESIGQRPDEEQTITAQPMQKHGLEHAIDLTVAVLFTGYGLLYLYQLLHGGDRFSLGIFMFYALAGYSFMRRQPVRRKGTWWEVTLALAVSFLLPVAFRPAPAGWAIPGLVLRCLGLAGMLAALLSLGRSFGLGAADRGLVTGRLYRFVRHPLYAAELTFFLGYLTANFSPTNLTVFALLLAGQVVRILREERIIAGYATYASQVRWRLVPLLW